MNGEQTPAEGFVAILCMVAVVLWCLNGPAILGVHDNLVVATIVAIFGSLVILAGGNSTLEAMQKARRK